MWYAFILRVLLDKALQAGDGVAVGLAAVLGDAVPVLHIGVVGLIRVGFEQLRPSTVGFGIVAILGLGNGGIEALFGQFFCGNGFECSQALIQCFVAVGLVGFELGYLAIELLNLAIGTRECVG